MIISETLSREMKDFKDSAHLSKTINGLDIIMKILVTGGAGFIGSHLCERFLKEGHVVWGLDNFDPYYAVSLKEENVTRLKRHPSFHLVQGDIRDSNIFDNVWRAFAPDRVVHLAACAGVRPSIAKPAMYNDVNVTATIRLFEVAQQHATPVVFASSSSVYGNSNHLPYKENDPLGDPLSPYAATKRAGELMAATYHHLHKVPVICLRFFTVYGPRQRPDMAIHKFAKALLTDQPITLFGDGTTARDYTYVSDIVDGILSAVNRAPQLEYGIFNLGSARPIQLLDLVRLLEKITGRSAIISWREMQPGDVKITTADISRAQEMLGYSPKISIEDGLRHTVDWLQQSLYLSVTN